MPNTQAPQPQPKPVQSGEILLKEAMRNPGVQELMRVVDEWQKLDTVAMPIRQAMAPKAVSWVSDSATPIR